jgi:MFS family permease
MPFLVPAPDSPIRLPAFRFYVSGMLLGVLAIQIQTVAVAWQVYELTKDNHATAALALGGVGLAEVIPFVGSVLFAGHIADKNNRHFIACCALGCMTLLGLILFIPRHLDTAWIQLTILYGVVTLGGLARSFLTTSRQAMIAEILQRSQIPVGIRWRNTLFELASVIGPGMAGFMLWMGGEQLCYVVMSTLMLSAFLCTLAVRTTHQLQSHSHESLSQSLKSGVQFMLNQRVMLGAFTLDLFAVLLGGAVALLPLFAEMLQVGPLGFGLLRAATSCGAVLMSIYLIFRPPFRHAGYALYSSFAIFGLCIIGFGLSIHLATWLGYGLHFAFVISFIFLFVSGAADAVNVIIRQTILQTRVPPSMMGRVSAVTAVFIGCSNELGMAESGLAARLLGTVNSVVLGGLAVFGVMGVTAVQFPEIAQLRKVDEGL